MTQSNQGGVPVSGADCVLDSQEDPGTIAVGQNTGVVLLDQSHLDVILQLPLPGIVIFVHGVNSDGEWFQATEKGLCAGLNARLKRCDEHLAFPTPQGGQLTPAAYLPDLTDDGFINPQKGPKSFIQGDKHFSPVIQFRWGYKANSEELQAYGDSIYLNEENYWGGGPFANGCSALPDLWSAGLSDSLLLFLNVEHINPDPSRNIFSCPPRAYYVLAALRLAKLVEAIRKKQADVPITIVCHSQGNMIGMAAAFLGDRMAPVKDAAQKAGRCVADNYVLCNAPFSLVKSNLTEDWGDLHMRDRDGGTGRQTGAARIGTLRAFFDIIRQAAGQEQTIEEIDEVMANPAHGYDAASDRQKFGYGPQSSTRCRVTLYCNPHDQVISATPVQGIGWRGLSAEEIAATGGDIFCQRVFAEGFDVGVKGTYDFWSDHWKKLGSRRGSQEFWTPESLEAKYSAKKGVASNRTILGKVLTVGLAPFMIVATYLGGVRINALPAKNWKIPLDAPELTPSFKPQSMRFGQLSDQFDQGYEAPGQSRDPCRRRAENDPYAVTTEIPARKGDRERDTSDAPKGDRDSEATLRYEDHARLRMQARREGIVKKTEKVRGEDRPEEASDEYNAWRGKKIKAYLADTVDVHATDHSTIMTNPMHAECALAYDVAIGIANISSKDMQDFRTAADWRFLKGLGDDDLIKPFMQYFQIGNFCGQSANEWVHAPGSEGGMPEKIVDQREHPAKGSPGASPLNHEG